ncbi:MAG: preprotein translocase subunit YajC [Candidatus Latescibacterota bacterium]
MNFEIISTAFAQSTNHASGSPSSAPLWPMFIVIFAIFYFFLIRPQRKKQKESQSMLDSLAKGDRIITIGGMFGTILSIKKKGDAVSPEDIIVIKVAENTKLEMLRSSIGRVLEKEGEVGKE